jgi:RNA polymerase sigma factor (sigma-70 family)
MSDRWVDAQFETIFREHYPRIVRVVRRVLQRDSEAEEVCADVFLRLYRKGPKVAAGGLVGGWLYRTATRASIDVLRSSQRRGIEEQLEGNDPVLVGEDAGSPLADVLRQERIAMKHDEMNPGMLRAYLDAQLDQEHAAAIGQHLEACTACKKEIAILRGHAARVQDNLNRLPEATETPNTAMAWAAFQKKREDHMENERSGWTWSQRLSLVSGGLAAIAVVLVLTVAPVRAWAESLLSVFRVQRVTVLEIDPATIKNNGLENNQLLNQAISRVISDEVTVTQKPQRPKLVTDAALASNDAGFTVRLLPDKTPSSLLLEGGAAMQMKLNRDRIQSILNEAGRGDLQIPESVDGATVGVRVPPGVMAFYGNCGDVASRMTSPAPSKHGPNGVQPPVQHGDDTCVSLIQLPSPIVSAPQQIDPAQIAQVGLQFLGMSASDAANFTQTVDWTSTLVLPVVRGQSKYEQVQVNGNEAALLRSTNPQRSDRFSLMWVDNGIVFALNGTGDDTAAISLASQLQ